MKVVVVAEVQRFMFRQGLQERARYYGVVFLNQMVLSHHASQGTALEPSLPLQLSSARQRKTGAHGAVHMRNSKIALVHACVVIGRIETRLLSSPVLHQLAKHQSSPRGTSLYCSVYQCPGLNMSLWILVNTESLNYNGSQPHTFPFCFFLSCAPVLACLGHAGGSDLAQRLIDIYFTLFKMILEGHIGRAAAAVKQQEAKHPTKSKDRHRDRQVSMPACLHPFLRQPVWVRDVRLECIFRWIQLQQVSRTLNLVVHLSSTSG